MIDCSRESAADADFLLDVDFLRQWERRHGRIPPGSWVLMRTDWSKRTDPVAYQNIDETGQHTPGPDTDAVKFLVDEREVLGFGSEAIGTDAGQAFHLKPPYPCHYYMHGAGRYRPAMPDQPRPAAADRRGDLCRAAEDQGRQRQSVARAGAGAIDERQQPPHAPPKRRASEESRAPEEASEEAR